MSGSNFHIIIDSNEQKPWAFDRRVRGCAGTITRKLQTSDYSIDGLEDLLMVERKASAGEWHQCLFAERGRFCRELDRMKGVPLAYVVLEFPLSDVTDYPRIPSVPHAVRKKIQISGSLLLKTHAELELAFPWVRFVFAGSREKAREYAICLFKRAVEYAATIGRLPNDAPVENP